MQLTNVIVTLCIFRQVPVENLIGKENKGFKYIMNNFNHERWSIIAQANRFARGM
jgi:alkylation response protein AidB-like acyl-CoA dehydrogenase